MAYASWISEFDEFTTAVSWELDSNKFVIDATPTEVKIHVCKTMINELQEQLLEIENINKKLWDKYEDRRIDETVAEIRKSINGKLSEWKLSLESWENVTIK